MYLPTPGWKTAVDSALDSSNLLRKWVFRYVLPAKARFRRRRLDTAWLDALFKGEAQYRRALEEEHRIPIPGSRELAVGWWPFGRRAACVVNFDDLSPKGPGNWAYDWGGDPDRGVNLTFRRVMDQFPHIKVTHFVCPDPQTECRLFQPAHPGDRFLITRPEHRRWLEWVHDEVETGRVEVAAHGLSHYNPRSTPVAAEFANEDAEAIVERLHASLRVFEAAGLTVRGLRPPAWGVGKDQAIVAAAKQVGFLYGALSSVTEGLNKGGKQVSNIYPTWVDGLLHLPQNLIIEQGPLFGCQAAAAIVKASGLLTPKGHYSDTYSVLAGLYPENVRNLQALLVFLEERYAGQIWYATYREVAEFWAAKAALETRSLPEGGVLIRNRSAYPLFGLTVRSKYAVAPKVINLGPGEETVSRG